jgi:hypothetical protein
MSRSRKERLLAILYLGTPEIAELVSAYTLLLWGLWLACPALHTFRVGPWHVLANLAPECVWAAAFLVLSVARFAVILSNHPWGRRVCSATAFVFWTLVGGAVFYADESSLLVPATFVIGLWDGWACIRQALRFTNHA